MEKHTSSAKAVSVGSVMKAVLLFSFVAVFCFSLLVPAPVSAKVTGDPSATLSLQGLNVDLGDPQVVKVAVQGHNDNGFFLCQGV